MRFSTSFPPGAVVLVLAALAPIPSAAGIGPGRWDVRLRLETEGRYALAAPGRDIAGTFAYEAVWTGILERDDPDFLMVHAGLETLLWELEERTGKEGVAPVLRETDVAVRPALHVQYVLSEDGRVRFFFAVKGFPVPRGEAPETFDLVLPHSRREAAASPQGGYDGGVVKGSNDVSLDGKALRKGPVKRVFRWSWKRYQPAAGPRPSGPLFNAHEAKVTLTVTPMPLDGTCRRPGGGGPG